MARSGAIHGASADKDEMIRWLFENSGELMHVAAPGGILKVINPAWERVLGWTEAECGAQAAAYQTSIEHERAALSPPEQVLDASTGA